MGIAGVLMGFLGPSEVGAFQLALLSLGRAILKNRETGA